MLNQSSKENFIKIQLFGEPAPTEGGGADDTDDTDAYEYEGVLDDYLAPEELEELGGGADYDDEADGEDIEDTGTDDADADDVDTGAGLTGGEGAEADKAQKGVAVPDIEAIKREAYERGIREGRVAAMSGKKNEYTGQPIEDEYDLEVYETMRAIDEAGGDPVADYAAHVADQRRQEAQKDAERVKARERYQTELVEFAKEMPNVDLKALFGDPKFKTFARGKLGPMTLKEVYADYSALTATAETDAEMKAKRIVAKQKATPGALSGKGTPKKFNEHELFEKMLHGELDE